jgi:hypothetical protein
MKLMKTAWTHRTFLFVVSGRLEEPFGKMEAVHEVGTWFIFFLPFIHGFGIHIHIMHILIQGCENGFFAVPVLKN